MRKNTQMALTQPELLWSRNRSPMIEKSTMRYAMNAKLTMMSHKKSQNESTMTAPFPLVKDPAQ